MSLGFLLYVYGNIKLIGHGWDVTKYICSWGGMLCIFLLSFLQMYDDVRLLFRSPTKYTCHTGGAYIHLLAFGIVVRILICTGIIQHEKASIALVSVYDIIINTITALILSLMNSRKMKHEATTAKVIITIYLMYLYLYTHLYTLWDVSSCKCILFTIMP